MSNGKSKSDYGLGHLHYLSQLISTLAERGLLRLSTNLLNFRALHTVFNIEILKSHKPECTEECLDIRWIDNNKGFRRSEAKSEVPYWGIKSTLP
jgi:hypothetical protein